MRVLSLVTNRRATFYRGQRAALRDRGVVVDTVSVPGSRSADGLVGRTPATYLRFYGLVLRSSLADYDLVHASYGLTAPAALLQPNRPVVMTLWGSDLMGRYGPLSKLCARAADEVVVMSTEMAEVLGQPCHVIPHGIDVERFQPASKAESRAALGWDDVDGYQVLFPYGPERPIKDYPRAERVVAAAEGRLEAPVELRSVTGVPHEEMPTVVNAADALLLTSEREGSPNSVKEALACNVPVVSTDVGDVSTMLRDVEPSAVGSTDAELVDGLVEVLTTGGRSNGRTMVQHIRLENQVEQLHGVYERALAETGRR
jgi:glycosyltransferase involved in cell wall biosynthesis